MIRAILSAYNAVVAVVANWISRTNTVHIISLEPADILITVNGWFAVGSNNAVYKSIDGGATWQRKTNTFTNSQYFTIAINSANVLVAGGYSGRMIYSTNWGETWSNVTTSQFGSSTINKIYVVEGTTLFIAGGSSGKLATSTNGSTWTARTSTFGTSIIQDIIYSTHYSKYILVGSRGKIAMSSTATSGYSLITSGIGSSETIMRILCGFYPIGNIIMALTNDGNIAVSSDGGTSWTIYFDELGLDIISMVNIGSSEGEFLGGNGNLYKSTDGINWTMFSAEGGTPFRYKYLGEIVLLINNYFKTSLDLVTWTNSYPNIGNNLYIHKIRYINDIFFTVGTQSKIGMSSTGEYWTEILQSGGPNGTTYTFYDAIYFNGLYIFCGGVVPAGGSIYYTSNLSTFSLVSLATHIPQYWVFSLCTSGTSAVASGNNGGLYRTINGTAWTNIIPYSAGGISINAIASNMNNIYVAVGSEFIKASLDDGLSWAMCSLDSFNPAYNAFDLLSEVEYGNGIYVAGGAGGQIAVSFNATTWHTAYIGSSSTVNSLCYEPVENCFYFSALNSVYKIKPTFDGIAFSLNQTLFKVNTDKSSYESLATDSNKLVIVGDGYIGTLDLN